MPLLSRPLYLPNLNESRATQAAPASIVLAGVVNSFTLASWAASSARAACIRTRASSAPRTAATETRRANSCCCVFMVSDPESNSLALELGAGRAVGAVDLRVAVQAVLADDLRIGRLVLERLVAGYRG